MSSEMLRRSFRARIEPTLLDVYRATYDEPIEQAVLDLSLDAAWAHNLKRPRSDRGNG